MKIFILTWALVLGGATSILWHWVATHPMSYLNKEYAILMAKKDLADRMTAPDLEVFGDSTPLAAVLCKDLGPHTVNLALGGSSPVETYFFIRRMMENKDRPRAVLLSFIPWHFVHSETFWERGAKFGLMGSEDIDQIFDDAQKLNDPEFIHGLGAVPIDDAAQGKGNGGSDIGLWGIDGRIKGFLMTHWFPSYYLSSILKAYSHRRRADNEETRDQVRLSLGQVYMGQEKGSKERNYDSRLKEFRLSPVIDLYFHKTIKLLEDDHVRIYYASMPTNEASLSIVPAAVWEGYADYLEEVAKRDSQFHLLRPLKNVYSWKFFGDGSHLNPEGARDFTRALAGSLKRDGFLLRP